MVTGPVDRFDVYLVALDPTLGSEIQKTRPCLVISPDEMNHHIATVIVAPMTTKGGPIPRGSLAGSRTGRGRSCSTSCAAWTRRASCADWGMFLTTFRRPCS